MALFAVIFLLFGVLMWVAAGVLLQFRRQQLSYRYFLPI